MSEQQAPRTSPTRPKEDAPLYHEYGILEQFNLPPKTVRYIRAHQRMLWSIFAGLVALALLIAGIDAWREHSLNKAAAALDAALHADKDQRAQLEEVMRDFASSPSALWAEVALARLDENENNIPTAIQRYQSVLAKLPKQSRQTVELEPLVLGKLAGLEEQRKNWGGALGYWRRLGNVEGFAADASMGIGRLKEAQGKKEEALAEYKKFVQLTAVSSEEAGEDPRRRMILAHIEVMQAKPAKKADKPADKPADQSPKTPAAKPAAPKAEPAPAQPAAAPKDPAPKTPAATPAAPKAEPPPAQPAAAPKAEQAPKPTPAQASAAPKAEPAPAQPAATPQQDKP